MLQEACAYEEERKREEGNRWLSGSQNLTKTYQMKSFSIQINNPSQSPLFSLVVVEGLFTFNEVCLRLSMTV